VLLVPLLMLVKFNETIVAFQSEILVVLGVVVQLKLVVMLLFQVVLLVLGVMVQLVVDKVQLVVDKVQFMVGMVVLELHDGKVLLVVLGVDELVELDDDVVDGNSVLRIKLHSKFSRFQSNELNSSLFQVSQLGRLMLTVGYDEVVVLELLVMDKVLAGHESVVEVLEDESVEKGLGRL